MSSSPKDAFVEHLLDLAWSHWTELGVAGTLRHHQDVLLDPEALILFTAALGDLDPRLRDESLDWCIQYGDAISVSRLKNLLKSGLGSEASLSAYASVVNQASTLRWPVAKAPRGKKSSGAAAMSGKSQAPDLRRPALYRLTNRAIFGVGTRADILTELLYETRQSAAELARIGYSKRQVAKTLDDLTRGGVLSRRQEGNTHRFELTSHEAWASLVGPAPKYYAHWPDCFRSLLKLRTLLATKEAKSSRMRAIAVQRTMEEIVDSIERLRWGAPVSAQANELWSAMTTWALERAARASQGAPDTRNVSRQVRQG